MHDVDMMAFSTHFAQGVEQIQFGGGGMGVVLVHSVIRTPVSTQPFWNSTVSMTELRFLINAHPKC